MAAKKRQVENDNIEGLAFDRGEQITLQDDHPILDAVQDSVRARARDGNRLDVGRCNLVTALRGEDGKNSASRAKIEHRSAGPAALESQSAACGR